MVGPPAYFLDSQGVHDAMLLPEILFFDFCPSMQQQTEINESLSLFDSI
jgi:hypothetical protein